MHYKHIALAALLALLGCAHDPPPVEEPAAGFVSVSDNALVHKLLQAAEVDPQKIDPQDRQRLLDLARAQPCPCQGQAGLLVDCLDQECIRAPFMVRGILGGIIRKQKDEAIIGQLLERFGPREPESLNLEFAACTGADAAPVVMVIFSDFECPYCALASKLIAVLKRRAGERLRICYKHWPLKYHKKARLAAQAAVAAQIQGQFWKMHDMLYENRQRLDRDDLLDYARQLGLDLERFSSDLDSPRTQARVQMDGQEAKHLRLSGTPFFFINGRRMTGPKSVGDFLDWFAEEIALHKAKKPR